MRNDQDNPSVTTSPSAATVESNVTVEEYEAWYRQAVEEAVDLEQLFYATPTQATNPSVDNETASTNSHAKQSDPTDDELTLLLIQRCLRACYQRTARLIDVPGKAEKQRIEQNTFINLALIPQKELLPPNLPSNHVMVIGEAGTGKSVLSQYLAYSWSEGTLWSGCSGPFKAVFWLYFGCG